MSGYTYDSTVSIGALFEKSDGVSPEKVVLLLQLAQFLQRINGKGILQLAPQVSVFFGDVVDVCTLSATSRASQICIVPLKLFDVSNQFVVFPDFFVESGLQLCVFSSCAVLVAASEVLFRRMLPLELASGCSRVVIASSISSAILVLKRNGFVGIAAAEAAGNLQVDVSHLFDGFLVPALAGRYHLDGLVYTSPCIRQSGTVFGGRGVVKASGCPLEEGIGSEVAEVGPFSSGEDGGFLAVVALLVGGIVAVVHAHFIIIIYWQNERLNSAQKCQTK